VVLPLGPDAHPDESWGFFGDNRLLVEGPHGLAVWPAQPVPTPDPEVIRLHAAEGLPRLLGLVSSAEHVVTRHDDGTLRLWNATGEMVDVIAHGSANAVDLRISGDGRRVTTVAPEGSITVWRTSDGALVRRIDAFAAGRVNAIATDGRGTIAAASTDGSVRVLDTVTGSETQHIAGGRNVDAVDISPDGDTIATGVGERLGESAFDDTVVLWHRNDTARRHQIGGEGEAVPGCDFFRNRVKFSPDGALLATSSHDFVISIWNVVDGSLNHRLPPHPGSIHDLAFSSDGSLLVSSSEAADLRIWNLERREIDAEHNSAPGGYRAVRYLPGDRTLAVSDITGTISLVDVDDGSIRAVLDGTKHRDGDLAVSPAGDRLAAGDDTGQVIVWSLLTGEITARLDGHTAPVRAIGFTPDGRSLVSGSDDSTVRLWDLDGE
jgi:WD40 repeat protein